MRVEINLTMRCNSACVNCNRLCNILKDRTEDMTPSQVSKFVGQCLENPGRVRRVKVVGGEPLLNPHFDEIIQILADGINKKAFTKVVIGTNGILECDQSQYPGVTFRTSSQRRKKHIPYLWSPIDLGLPIKTCRMPFSCGVSLDKFGYLPCSAAIMIARGFELEGLYKKELPKKVLWGMDDLCKHCVHALPREWKNTHSYKVTTTPKEAKKPTPEWKQALDHIRTWKPIDTF